MSLVSGLLNQVIDTISSVSRNEYNKETLTTVYSDIPCRWQESKIRRQTNVMENLDFNIIAWLDPDYDIESSYIVTKGSKNYKIKNIGKHYDLSGKLDHISLYLE